MVSPSINSAVAVVVRFSQSTYSQSENISPLSVSLVLDSGSASQQIVAQILTSVQGGDTATGKEVTDRQSEVSLL